ncbi:DUF421 domain-containing protein [Chungangia koreensis]|uniref:DUF421 domain-containing protein n=1 Tax=Chungangia koreensis TaxID=752657 RepID=A0ABV8WZF6_9LACT
MFFSDWQSVGRVLLLGILSYILLIVVLRISGNRTLAKMNAFDLIVTVALGSTLATILLNKNVTLAEGVTSFVVLVGLQFVVAKLSVRSTKFGDLVKSSPKLLFYRGDYQENVMRDSRVTESEILQAVRQQGISSLDDVDAVILETNGKFSVIQKIKQSENSTLSNV